jgi:hypothetical protein
MLVSIWKRNGSELRTYHIRYTGLTRGVEFLRIWDSKLRILGGRSHVYVVSTDLLFFQTCFFSILIVGVEDYCCTWSYSVTNTHTHTHTHTWWDLPWTMDRPVAETSTMSLAGFESEIPAGVRPQIGRPPFNVNRLKLRQESVWNRYSRSKNWILSVRPAWRMSWAAWVAGRCTPV